MRIENKKSFLLGLFIILLAVGSVIIRFFVFDEFSVRTLIKGIIGLAAGLMMTVMSVKLEDEDEVDDESLS